MKNSIHKISPEKLNFKSIFNILKDGKKIEISEESKGLIIKCRLYLDNKMESHKGPIYGINTGFGALYNKTIGHEDLGKLQENLVKSHACGLGDEVPQEIVKLMLLLKAQSLCYGHSGVQLSTVQWLLDFFNNVVVAVVYQLG